MKRMIGMAMAAALLSVSSGCGTLFFSHRIGKQASKMVDKRVFYTNCFLCLCGVIPGVVAFILDYDNGTIYYTEAELLPDDLYGMRKFDGMDAVPCKRMEPENIAARLSLALGKEISPAEIRVALDHSKTPEFL